MGEHGLAESPHTVSRAATVLGYRGKGDELTEAQTSVSIPKYGSSPNMNAAFLPGKRIQQLLKIVGNLKGIDAADFSYDVTCYLPSQRVYAPVLDLPIVVAILASYLHQPVDDKTLFIGEVDLTRQVRPPSHKALQQDRLLLPG